MDESGDIPVTREAILQLIRRRDGIETSIKNLGDILKSNNVGISESLTVDGFPRNDIDVYQVRHARHAIICLQNDFKSLTNEIETKLTAYHQSNSSGLQNGHGRGIDEIRMDTTESRINELHVNPIVKVNLVSDGSPAFHAGLKVGDQVLSFGSINSQNFSDINDIGTVVSRSQGQVLTINVNRNGTLVQLALIPGPWQGRGLLGCNIIPLESIDR